MISSLRKKFVIVTTTLMLVIFSIFFVASYINNRYWNRLEIADMLNLVANSGYFSYYPDSKVEETIKNLTEGSFPIVGIITDKTGNIISTKVVGGKTKLISLDNIIKEILKADENCFELNHYLYSKKNLENGNVLIVILDTSADDNFYKKIIGTLVIILVGIFMLILIIIYLSKFVTEPAEKALLREKQFISDASHELKTPLGAISINSQALEITNPDNLYVKNIINEATRMGRLIEKLLVLAKLEEGNVSKKSKMLLSDVILEMVLTYESLAFQNNLSYTYDIEENIFIYGNCDEIKQLIAILIDNAIKNAGNKGFVEISCKKSINKVQFQISNSGVGILPEDLPHVFDRFYTSDKSRTSKSFGLGLAIANVIVCSHKGEISVKSIPNRNTVFTVILKTE